MSDRLEKCTGCARHIRVSEATCPFCNVVLADSFREPRSRATATGRIGRAALFALGATAVGVAANACSSDDTQEVADGGPPIGIAAYGTVVGIGLDGGEDAAPDSSLGDGGGDASHEDASFDDGGDGGDADTD
jgi:hypothetical protein